LLIPSPEEARPPGVSVRVLTTRGLGCQASAGFPECAAKPRSLRRRRDVPGCRVSGRSCAARAVQKHVGPGGNRGP